MDDLHSLDINISLEENLRIIDELIEKPQAPLLTLKFRRNSLVPISRLPPEVLCEIFSFAQHSAGPDRIYWMWINLTYVCRHWRNIALDSPNLWVYLPIGNLQWVQEMLRRSKNFSLVIRSYRHHLDDVKKSGLELALQHIHCVRELSMEDLSLKTWHPLKANILRKPAPRLECLGLAGPLISIDRWDPIFVTEDILCKTDRLRRLHLACCRLNWDSHLLHSLTHLTLYRLLRTFMPAGKRFVDILADMPELNFLELYDSLPHEDGQQSSWRSEDIYFAHLQTLQIIDSMIPEIEALFRCITFPPTTMVRIGCYPIDGGHNVDPDFSGIVSGLARSYSGVTPDTNFQNLILLRSLSGDGIQLKLFTIPLTDFEMIRYANAAAHLELVFQCPNNLHSCAKALNDFFTNGIHLDDITGVFFAGKIRGLAFETIANTFGKLSRVHSVVAAESVARSFLAAMNSGFDFLDASGSTENSVHSFSFPSLSLVYIYDLFFTKDYAYPERSDGSVTMQLLRDTLIQRCNLGVAIDTLVLRDCWNVSEGDIELLKEIVVNVDWSPPVEYGEETEEGSEPAEEDGKEGEFSDS